MSFAEICRLQSPRTEVALFTRKNYKKNVSVGLHVQSINTVKFNIYTGASPILIDESFVHPPWALRVKHRDFPNLRSANQQPIKSEGVILLHLQIGDLRIRVWFGVDGDFVDESQLGISFFHRFFQGIIPAEWKLVPWHSLSVNILTHSSKTRNAVSFADHGYATAPVGKTRHIVVVFKPVTLAPYLHSPDIVTKPCSDLLFITLKTLRAMCASLKIAEEIIEVAPRQPLHVLPTNMLEKQVFIQMRMIIAQKLERTQLVTPSEATI